MEMGFYKYDSDLLIKYMKNTYNTEPYQFDDNGLIIFPLNRWLKGEESGFLLRHYKTYNALKKYPVFYK